MRNQDNSVVIVVALMGSLISFVLWTEEVTINQRGLAAMMTVGTAMLWYHIYQSAKRRGE